MKAYRSITTKIDFSKPYYLFNKLDGSNLRAEWSPKQGFYKFGSRTQLLTPDQATLWPFVDHFMERIAPELDKRFRAKKFERAIAYNEWCGSNSFAGSHPDPLETLTATVIDIDVYKKGLMVPDQFIEFTYGLPVPDVLYKGRLTEETFQSVRNRTLSEKMSLEGVVGKGYEFDRSEGGPTMFKIKSNDWLNRLKVVCGGDEQMFNRLK